MKRKYYLFDSGTKTLGRLATEVATILSGKQKVDYTPNKDEGDFVVVINADNLCVTGNKMKGKLYHHFSGYPGGIRTITLEEQIKRDSREVIKSAVYGMLPKNKLRKPRMRRLLVYKNEKHAHEIDVTK